MRKFTLYQASKYSKISRYKLEQAITDGLINTIEGKGNIKCFILEDEMQSFIDTHGDEFIKYSFDNSSEEKPYISPEISNFISKDLFEKILSEKERVIQMLQVQGDSVLPLITETNANKEKIEGLIILAQEAINLVPGSSEKTLLTKQLRKLLNPTLEKV